MGNLQGLRSWLGYPTNQNHKEHKKKVPERKKPTWGGEVVVNSPFERLEKGVIRSWHRRGFTFGKKDQDYLT